MTLEEIVEKRVLKKLEEIKEKVKMQEDCPESEFDIHTLNCIEESLDEILNMWYY